MNLTSEHLDLLRAVDELEAAKQSTGTTAVGERLLEMWKGRGKFSSWRSSPPWNGTHPYAEELRAEGLLEVDVGMAEFRRWDEPAGSAQEYWLSITEAGRQAMANPVAP